MIYKGGDIMKVSLEQAKKNLEKKYGFKNVWYEPKFFISESEDEALVEFWGYLYGKKSFYWKYYCKYR